MMVTPKPCPFCGYDKPFVDTYRHESGVRYRVICPGCATAMDPGYFQNAGRAVEAWNRRVFEPLINVSEEVRRGQNVD